MGYHENYSGKDDLPATSPDGRGAWVITYEDGTKPYSERFYFESCAREYGRLLPDTYTHILIELGQTA